jgi:glyoxylase-like metal-dependent hydrolase (beta-lactamase superfamily II)
MGSLSEDGIDRADIRYIINTHSHPDHYEGSEAFSGSGVSIGLHRKELDFLADIGAQMYEWFGLEFPKVDVDLVLPDGDLTLGDEKFQVHHVPGHSPGSIGLYWPERKVLFPGDVVFSQNVGRSDFPGGDGELLKKSIRRLSKLDIDFLLPGHMGIVEGNKNVQNNFKMIIQHIFPFI